MTVADRSADRSIRRSARSTRSAQGESFGFPVGRSSDRSDRPPDVARSSAADRSSRPVETARFVPRCFARSRTTRSSLGGLPNRSSIGCRSFRSPKSAPDSIRGEA
ncbi:MAG TPA: hypothetical protein DCQ98_11165 [Planctomycetaceae bacterium]|nr:hypothetical protein [Planctomycetaceae bacterium]